MRHDGVGMFWEDVAAVKADKTGTSRADRPPPAIPETGWTTPRDFPNLSAARCLSVDTETKDPHLLTHGPGWARKAGHLVGVSVGTEDGFSIYLPMRHEVEPEYNMDPDKVLAWLGDTLTDNRPKIGANLYYDVGWLQEEGVKVRGRLVDVQYAEALLVERGEVNLDHLAAKYLGEHKETSLLYRWLADAYGGAADDGQRRNLYRSPPRLAGPYAMADASLPHRIAAAQWPYLHHEGLAGVFDMECRLIPLLVAMRFAGVRVDHSKADELRAVLVEREAALQIQIDMAAGTHVDVDAGASLAVAFDRLGLRYERTPTGKPSFRKEWLENHDHPISDLVLAIRKLRKLRGTFLESYVINSHVDGVLYGQFHPLRSDDGGTRSGRFSSSNPNLQNVPSRDKQLAPLVRGLFVPHHGHKQWRKYDYSQIEYRFLVHFAEGPGADEARARYREQPDTDYHEFVIGMVAALTGYVLDRSPAKNLNFGLIYGMGIKKLLRTLGLDKDAGERLFAAYHAAIPYAKNTMEQTSDEAQRTGIITTVLGRRSRFEYWESTRWRDGADKRSAPYELAMHLWGDIRRAMTHKALNRRLQGSAADLIKLAMLTCWEQGIFDYTGVPVLQVHDELDFSDSGDADDAFEEMRRIMETVLPLRVPVVAELEVGPNWGATKKVKRS